MCRKGHEPFWDWTSLSKWNYDISLDILAEMKHHKGTFPKFRLSHGQIGKFSPEYTNISIPCMDCRRKQVFLTCSFTVHIVDSGDTLECLLNYEKKWKKSCFRLTMCCELAKFLIEANSCDKMERDPECDAPIINYLEDNVPEYTRDP